jgi:hypothetical protein
MKVTSSRSATGNKLWNLGFRGITDDILLSNVNNISLKMLSAENES